MNFSIFENRPTQVQKPLFEISVTGPNSFNITLRDPSVTINQVTEGLNRLIQESQLTNDASGELGMIDGPANCRRVYACWRGNGLALQCGFMNECSGGGSVN